MIMKTFRNPLISHFFSFRQSPSPTHSTQTTFKFCFSYYFMFLTTIPVQTLFISLLDYHNSLLPGLLPSNLTLLHNSRDFCPKIMMGEKEVAVVEINIKSFTADSIKSKLWYDIPKSSTLWPIPVSPSKQVIPCP